MNQEMDNIVKRSTKKNTKIFMSYQCVKCKETLILVKHSDLGIWSWHPKLLLFVTEPGKVMNYFVQWLLIKVLVFFLIPNLYCTTR
jgi:hypothetical protein